MDNKLIIQKLWASLDQNVPEFRSQFTLFPIQDNCADLEDESSLCTIILNVRIFSDYQDNFNYEIFHRIREIAAEILKEHALEEFSTVNFNLQDTENYQSTIKAGDPHYANGQMLWAYWATVTATDAHIIITQITYPQ